MANKIIRYNLTNAERTGSKRNGKTPTFIADGGWYPKANSNDSPADWDFIGATVDGSSEEGLGVFANQAAVKTYIDSFISEWPEFADDADPQHPMAYTSSTAAAAGIWTKKID